MSRAKILIVTSRWDATAYVAAEVLRRSGRESAFFYPDDIPQRAQLDAVFKQGKWSNVLHTEDGLIDLDKIKAVWWRKPLASRPPDDLSRIEFLYSRRENSYALNGLWGLLAGNPDVYWMSDPQNIRKADNKMLQMARATAHGLTAPNTIITNNPEDVRGFYDRCSEKMVFKSMTGVLLPPDDIEVSTPSEVLPGIPLVRPFTGGDMDQVDSVRQSACMFQELVEKKHELRVTVFEDQVFTCQIDSQKNDLTRYDWRRQDFRPHATTGQLPDYIESACLAMLEEFGLHFGAFDFIVTPEGEHIFLEVNPNGQWVFIQEWVPELRLMQGFVDVMTRNS
ncbi:MvdC/MvdD family ATP grasp protein [Kitasatospora sp. NPDC058032]|uniref:MvdC/MvdD family ATP grasp protein n=1 Tax=Kitasatospora sp. NPDC058032 TaxID=3346307 RepID=UPI0036DCE845